MGKRVRRASKQEQNEDRISLLPVEILVSILSVLGLKEAAVTSVLSRRWRNLWAFITRLDFDAEKTLDKIVMNSKLLETERPKYVNWVNQVLGLHKGPTIEEFRVSFDLDKSSKSDIDNWLRFALARRVQKLELDLSRDACYIRRHPIAYVFPFEMISQSRQTSLKNVPSNLCVIRHCTFVGLKYLKALSLICVNVTGYVLECILSECPHLERLRVQGSGGLVNLKVSGTSLVLKYLEICYCHNLNSIEICNTNLVTLIYMGQTISLLLENVPLLVELSISKSLSDFLPQLSCCLPQLETLTMQISKKEEIEGFHVSPQLTSLKKMVLLSDVIDDEGIQGCTSFINAAPFLQKFVLEAEWMNPSIDKRKVRKVVKCPHHYLEEVELLGYYGRKSDLELVLYFLENAVALKKIIVNPRYPDFADSRKDAKAARSRAKQQLKGVVPPNIELVIL